MTILDTRMRLTAAKQDIKNAEDELESAIGTLRNSPRAEKTTISNALESAFATLKAARAKLIALEGELPPIEPPKS